MTFNRGAKNTYTLYNAILRIARNFLETRENIKISTHPFYHINLGWFSLEWSKKKFTENAFFGCFWAFVGHPHGHTCWATSYFEFFFSKKNIFLISPNLYGRMDWSKFWWFPCFPENSLLCVILRYTVYLPILSHFGSYSAVGWRLEIVLYK